MAVMSFLAGLPSEFETAKSQFLSSSEIGSLQEVFSRILRTEGTSSIQQTNNVLVAKGGSNDTGRKSNNRGGSKTSDSYNNDSSNIVCYYCHEPGHTKKYCKKLQNRNQRNQIANVATASSTSSSSSDKTVMVSADEFAKFSQYQESLKISTRLLLLLRQVKHVLSPPQTNGPSPVTIADGSTSNVVGSGTVKPTSSITLSFVLSLPKLAFNLISVSKLTKDLNCCISFFPDHCLFQDLMTKQIIGKGHVSDGLYILDAWVPRSVACSSIASSVKAHCRLGHPSLPVLKKLCPQFHSLPSFNCESCHFAKHHRSSLSPRVNKRVESIFELVHSDVWGPCPVTSKTGFRYFVTFVDDFSRTTWIYFMKNRSEVFFHFMHFVLRLKHSLISLYEH
ncbi:hypothetical protein AAG906_010069 [Vitis piasezkii]